jgi:hypothetical protein
MALNSAAVVADCAQQTDARSASRLTAENNGVLIEVPLLRAVNSLDNLVVIWD